MPRYDARCGKEPRRKGIDREKKRYNDRFYHLRVKYGLTPEGYSLLWDRQGGRCAICSCILEEIGLNGVHVDHDHFSGAVRGLLCAKCNRGLGQFNDEPELLRLAADYIERG